MPEKIVLRPAQDKTLKPKEKEKPDIADEPLHAEEAKGDNPTGSKSKPKAEANKKPEKKERNPFINRYGFLHVDKALAEHLGVKFGKDKENVPVTIEPIERGFIVKLKA